MRTDRSKKGVGARGAIQVKASPGQDACGLGVGGGSKIRRERARASSGEIPAWQVLEIELNMWMHMHRAGFSFHVACRFHSLTPRHA